jgi:hypothetical protein
MDTSFTEKNPCRRFANCGNKHCERFTWIDSQEMPTYCKECLNILLREYGELDVESSSSSRSRRCKRCEELEILLDKKEKEIDGWKKEIHVVEILGGIVIGFLLAIFLVIISK